MFSICSRLSPQPELNRRLPAWPLRSAAIVLKSSMNYAASGAGRRRRGTPPALRPAGPRCPSAAGRPCLRRPARGRARSLGRHARPPSASSRRCLAACRRAGRCCLVTAPGGLAGHGRPHGHGLNGLGLDPARVILVETADDKQALWAMEEALRSGVPAAVVGRDRKARFQGQPTAASRRRRFRAPAPAAAAARQRTRAWR